MFLLGTVSAAPGCTSQPPNLTVEEQYAELSGMFLGAGSIFMKIRNAWGKDALIAATAGFPNATVELHDVKNHRMVRTERIPIPSQNTAELKPGSRHLMIFNMPKTVRAGSEITLTLKFEKTGDLQVPVRFEKPLQTSVPGGR